jgi:hypothetical protein
MWRLDYFKVVASQMKCYLLIAVNRKVLWMVTRDVMSIICVLYSGGVVLFESQILFFQ